MDDAGGHHSPSSGRRCRAGLARASSTRRPTAAWGSASWTSRCSWRRWAARWCRAPFFSAVLLGGLPILEAGSRGAEEGVAAEDRGAATSAWRLALMEPNAPLGAAGVTLTARESGRQFTLAGTKLFVLDAHTADASWWSRADRGQRREDGLSLFLRAPGHRGPHGEAPAHDGPDAQALRGHVRPTSRSAPTRCSAPRMAGGPLWRACSTAPRWRSAPRCAAAPRACST